jgi:hypothetical protein
MPEPVLRRLTATQYTNSVIDLFSDELLLPTRLEPDIAQDGLLSIGAGEASISPLGVEQYEDAAFLLIEQAMEPGGLRDALIPCAPSGTSDDACARQSLEPFARRAWRRPLTTAELDGLVDIAGIAGDTLVDFYDGYEMALAAVLQNPAFIYRIELGEPDPNKAGSFRYTDHEMASRLSYFLWNTTPDLALMDAAAAGELTDPAMLVTHVDRMLDDPRARDGFGNFVEELLSLAELEALNKDPEVFPAMRSEIGPSAREETLRTVEALVFDRDDDFRTWVTTRETFVDPNLAMIYAVPAPQPEGFGAITLPSDGARRGLLGQVSVLAGYSHPTSTSATLRGLFVREVLLCSDIPPPPADVDTSIPESSPDAPTRRERVEAHLTDPFCATCHEAMDLIGLGLENFDGLGLYREYENGALIDASGDIDGEPFTDAWGLGQVLADDPQFAACMSDMIYAYGAAHRPTPGEVDLSLWLHGRFGEEGYSMQSLLHQVATSTAFRTAGEVAP